LEQNFIEEKLLQRSHQYKAAHKLPTSLRKMSKISRNTSMKVFTLFVLVFTQMGNKDNGIGG